MSLKLLVVDDETEVANAVTEFGKKSGYDVVCAYTGNDALAVAERVRPDIMLLDIGLPGLDGYALARLARERPETSGIRLVAVTGYGQAGDRQRALAAGFDQHVTKPVDPALLRDLLARR